MSTHQPTLIIDGANLFIRSWAAFPTMSSHGYQMGGCIGFLKTLRKLVREYQPEKIYIAWEGGGSARRRKIFPEYKLSRRPEKLNRFYADDIPDTEENRQHQLVTLIGMLRNIPVYQLYTPDCEGDDIIAYLCRTQQAQMTKKIIVSSDKDMYQLLQDDTTIYSLHKKTLVHEADVLTEFRVRASNFALAKAICGDVGDNVPGIKGFGFKTISKLYPMLGTDNNILLQDVIDYASAHIDDSTLHRRLVEKQDDLRRNWKLVFLDGSMLSGLQTSQIDHILNTYKPKSDRINLIKQLVKEGLGDFNVSEFFYDFVSVK